MAKRLRTWFFSLCMFLSFCNWSFADIPQRPYSPQAPALMGWNEPRSCFKRGEVSRLDCMYRLNKLALAHMKKQQFVAAIARFTQILSIEEHAIAFAHRGAAFAHLERFVEARKDYKRAVTLSPILVEPWSNLAEIDLMFRKPIRALAHITHAVALKPNNVEYRLMRAEIYVALGKHALAATEVRAAIALSRMVLPDATVSGNEGERSADAK